MLSFSYNGMAKSEKKLKVIDLFSGCGGLSLGLKKAGFRILLGADLWADSLATFKNNHPDSQILKTDISKVDAIELKKAAKDEPHVIVGGPPCQGFSLSGPRNFYDKRNRLYLDFIRMVKKIRPEAFIVENVPGLAGLFGGEIKNKIIDEFSKAGYAVNAQILNASDYGVPQNRKRIFFVGLKNKKIFQFPLPTHSSPKGMPFPSLNKLKQKVTVGEAINDLPLLENEYGLEKIAYNLPPLSDYQQKMRKGSSAIYNHVASRHSERTKKIIGLVPEGGNYKNLPEHFKNSRNFHIAWTRLDRNKPSPTIDTGHRHHFHPVANRVPTVRECARLQSFPDRFVFYGNKTSQYKQVGNAVPPILAEAIGRGLLEYL